MQSAHAEYRATRYFASLDGLRAVAILPVIWHHSSLSPLPGVLGKGPAGVQLFFVISGFLVTTLLLRERDAQGVVSLRRFYVRRSLRIFPLYYLVLAGITAKAWWSPPSASITHFFEHWIYFATFTSHWWVDWNVAHPILFAFAWTLAVEEQFYLTWAPLLRWLRKSVALFVVIGGFLLLSQAVTWPAAAVIFPDGLWTTFCGGLSSSICLGSLLALGLHHAAAFRWLYPLLGHRASALMAFGGVIASLAFDVHHLLFHGALCAWVGSCVVRREHALRRVLTHRWLVFVGRCSYGLYLTHFIAIGVARLLVDPTLPVLVFATALPLALLIARLSLEFVEEPFSRLKKHYAATTQGSAPEQATDARGATGHTFV